MSIDVDKISNLLIECAEKYILPRYKLLKNHEIDTKTGPNDLVTYADLEVEEHLKRVLPLYYSGSIVVGEEGVSQGTISLDTLKGDGAYWVVDPVDGTYNFVHGKPEFGVMLALVEGGRTRAGWIYNILGKEMLIAEQGAGAFIGEHRLKVSTETRTDHLIGFLNPGFFPKKYHGHIKAAQNEFKACRSLRCAAHEYLNILKGDAHFSLYSRVKPWDHLPGALMIQEAGGCVATWEGEAYYPASGSKGLIVASSQQVWNEVFEKFLSPLSPVGRGIG